MLTPMVFYKNRPATPSASRIPAEKVRHYVLEVTFNVKRDELIAFAAQSKDLIPTFRTLGLNPRSSAWTEEEGGRARVYNYWDIGSDANQLLEAELALPDIPRFNTFNIIVRDEVKNLTIPIAAEEVVQLPNGGKLPMNRYGYLRVESTVSNANFSEFVARVEGYMSQFTAAAQWFLGETFYGVTGREGSVSQQWIVPLDLSVDAANAILREAPWFRAGIAEHFNAQLLVAAPADQNLV